MIIENPSYFSLKKMQELIGKSITLRDESGPITKIKYSMNDFGDIDGYSVYADNVGIIPYHYPNDFHQCNDIYQHLDISSCELSDEFRGDIKQALDRIKETEKLNGKKLESIRFLPVTDRIAMRKDDSYDGPLYKLYLSLRPAFMLGDYSAVFNFWSLYGEVRLIMKSPLQSNYKIYEIVRHLDESDVEEFLTLYSKFDFLCHEREKDAIGLDGITLYYSFYDGDAYRCGDCWCPDEDEKEFMLLKYLFRFYRECFTEDGAHKEMDDIWKYFHCNEAF